MRLLINLSTLKKGGGQNVALNFLKELINNKYSTQDYFFLVVDNSPIHHFLKNNNQQNILLTSSSPIKRIIKELFFVFKLKKLKIDIVYTYFGFALWSKKIPQVCGVAVSNIFFPEIKFWEGNIIQLSIRNLIDKYRFYGIKNATALIFENRVMEERSHSLFKIPVIKTMFIPPSFSSSFDQEVLDVPELNNRNVKLLLLCGWQLNKNILKVPEIAYYLKKLNCQFQFVITAPNDNSKIHKKFKSLLDKFKVHDMISIIGPVKKEQLYSLYNQINFVLLMSKLESFSNNIIEAWHFHKPLVISDEEWAHSICENAAFYVNRENAQEIAGSIEYLVSNKSIQSELIEEGLKQINNYPSVTDKTRQEISFIEKIFNEYKSHN